MRQILVMVLVAIATPAMAQMAAENATAAAPVTGRVGSERAKLIEQNAKAKAKFATMRERNVTAKANAQRDHAKLVQMNANAKAKFATMRERNVTAKANAQRDRAKVVQMQANAKAKNAGLKARMEAAKAPKTAN